MSAQDRTLDQYQKLTQINAASHLMRAARELGVLDELGGGQRTCGQLCEALSLSATPANLLLDGLVAIGIVEKYEDDFALSQAARLLCRYDDDLGDSRWLELQDRVRGAGRRPESDQRQFEYQAATQWIHTGAAIQAAEVLNIGGADEPSGLRILDLGCGSAVWSCAMAHQDALATITAVDEPGAMQAARSTADSIGLLDRLEALEADPLRVELPGDAFDLVLIPQRLSSLSEDEANALLSRAITAAKVGGRIVVIDLFRGPTKPNLAESIEALQLELCTGEGRMRTIESIQSQLGSLGLQQIQFTFLPASRVNMGLAVAVKAGEDP
jgi:ubiquinone/menaquinone biosynthesis C-methylase UbiE